MTVDGMEGRIKALAQSTSSYSWSELLGSPYTQDLPDVAAAAIGNKDLLKYLLGQQRLPDAEGVVRALGAMSKVFDKDYSYRSAVSNTMGSLTLQQLHALESAAPRGHKWREDSTWVRTVISKMTPADGVDLKSDLEARGAYLDSLVEFVDSLSDAFRSYKVEATYMQMQLVQQRGGSFAGGEGRSLLNKFLAYPV
jgi:hypothetical protein